MNSFTKAAILTLTMLIAAGCSAIGLPSNRSMEAFKFNKDCPNICFLGMQPLKTTPLEAFQILKNARDIDQKTISIDGLTAAEDPNDFSLQNIKSGDDLAAVWHPMSHSDYQGDIYITTTNNRIDHINASPVLTTIQDFVDVIGEPDRIQVSGYLTIVGYFITYSIYYTKWNFLINVESASIDGPKLDDGIFYVMLNPDIKLADFQAWKGFGNMKEYMSAEQLSIYQQYPLETPAPGSVP